jgi:hypothetical protein
VSGERLRSGVFYSRGAGPPASAATRPAFSSLQTNPPPNAPTPTRGFARPPSPHRPFELQSVRRIAEESAADKLARRDTNHW